MKVLNALQISEGAKVDNTKAYTLIQPVQFLSKKDKDEAWAAWNIDWIENEGIKQLQRNARKTLKNYKLVNGIIDRTDYIVEEDNEVADLIDTLTLEDESAFELKFYPIIPNVVNVLVGEHMKRSDKIVYRAVDDESYNMMMQDKYEMIEQTLLQYGQQKMQQAIEEMQLDMENEEAQQYLQQMMSQENIKTLPEIQEYFTKDYRALIEEWATHQHAIDEERFYMRELEAVAFKDMLTIDKEFWHFKMNEDDYEIEVWNPLLTFYHKSPETKYISQSKWVGRVDLLTIPEIIDKYGYKMTQEQLESLEHLYPVRSADYLMPGVQNDGSFYDASQSKEWNQDGPSLGMRQFLTARELSGSEDDVLSMILTEPTDIYSNTNEGLMRATTCYWMSQKKVGHLTRIEETGELIEMIVSEDYRILEKAIYDTNVIKNKVRENLLLGEHIDWIWINQAWGGVKLGPNRQCYYGDQGFNPMYLNCKPLRFQFKGDYTLYGAKLPVEGCIFSERNSKSVSLVDKMKPFQIGYNLVNNQISDILIDELGTIILLDQNSLPKKSLGEDWGKDNFQKAFVAMKNFQMLPLDTTLANTESPTSFQHWQKLDMAQTERLMSRINLSMYFKQQAFETIGLTPQRMGNINAQETATGVEQAINMSYSQTESYFTQHSEYLMPRVHQMRTDLAQYYQSTRPSVRLQYMTTMDERVNFQIFGTELLSKELNVYITTNIRTRQLIEQLRQLAVQNNTTGATIFDLGTIMKAESLAEINSALKKIEEKTNKIRQQEQQHQEQMIKIKEEGENARLEAKLRYEAEQADAERENKIDIAEIRAAGYAAMQDRNDNKQNDYIDTLEYLDKRDAANEQISLKREKQVNDGIIENQKLSLKRKEIESREKIAEKQLQVAKENKNRFDKKKS